MAKDDLTPEEAEILAKANRDIWKKLLPNTIGKHNPKWVDAAKGTPLADMSYPEIVDYSNSLKPLYLKSWKDFSNGWVDAFGGRDKRPLKESPDVYLNGYVNHIIKNPTESKKGNMGAAEWLKKKLDEEKLVG